METVFEYYAFISYKREDEKWAKWLQKKLESYKLPTVIRKENPHLPKYIRPIFRDKTDLGAGILKETLRQELERSQYLIVICSPQSAKSEWVGKEIQDFIEMGRTNRIIPFIISGEPNSKNPQQECFHSVIKEKIPDILGLNVKEIGENEAFIKIIAKLWNLPFDKLWRRHKKRQLKRKVFVAIIISILFVGLGFIWDYNRVKYEYYNDYVEFFGIPKGIYPVSKNGLKFRNETLRFSYCQRKLQKMEVVSSYGNLTAKYRYKYKYFDPSIKKEFYYNQNGQLFYIVEKNELDSFWVKKIVAPNLSKVEFKDEKGNNTISIQSAYIYWGKDTTKYEKKYANNIDLKICKHNLEFDKNGRCKRIIYLNAYDEVVEDDGIAGYEINYTDIGQVKDIKFINKNGQYHSTVEGASKVSYLYDKMGNIVKRTIDGLDGKPVSLLIDGYSSVEMEYDVYGNVTNIRHLGVDMKPICTRFGFAEIRIEYRIDGLIKSSSYYDTLGNLTQQKNRKTAKKEYQYDKNGKRTMVFHYNTNGQLIETEELTN